MKVKKIFCIIGYMATGKDTIVTQASKILGDKVKVLVSHTTRPMRKGEKEGREYYFINNKEFLKMKEYGAFVESRKYNTKVEENGKIIDATWFYGLSAEEVENNEYSIVIVDAEGYMELREKYGRDLVTPIYISAKDDIIRERALARGDLEEEVNRRIADDKKRFLNFRVNIVYKTIKNEGNIEDAVDELIGYICKVMGVNKICPKKKK